MANTTVKDLAKVVGISVERLLEQLKNAGIPIADADQEITNDQKSALLAHLQSSRSKKTTISTSSAKSSDSEGSAGDVRQGSKKISVTRIRPSKQHLEKLRKQAEMKQAAIKQAEEDAERKAEEAKKAAEAASEKEQDQSEVADVHDPIAVEPEAEAMVESPKVKAEEPEDVEVPPKKDEAPKEAVKKETKEEVLDSKKPAGKKKSWKDNKKAEEERRAWAAFSKHAKKETSLEHGFTKPAAPKIREVAIPETIIVSDLAQKLAVKAGELIKVMMEMGAPATINQVLDQETASLVVEEMGHKAKLLKSDALESEFLEEVETQQGEKQSRAPVITIMGHVDHGKTSLLDYIRRTKVTSSEAGGITQHIGAYQVNTDRGTLTFLDTPGHEAFTAMRARGAEVTDIVILVVAADDGVKPQTIEAVQHAKAAGVPMVVAVNKIDKPDIDVDRVKNELAQRDVIPEDWGGDVMFMPISAKTGQGVDELLDALSIQAEMLELTAPATGPASGVVVESRVEKGRGPVSTMLIRGGNLKKGDVLIAGSEYGRVRAMLSDSRKDLKDAGPSTPVEIIGLSGTPEAGEQFAVVATERKARELAMFRQSKSRELKIAKQQSAQLENVFNQMSEGEISSLNIVLKADVQGSKEAICESLRKLATNEVKVNIVASGVGGLNESDINLAIASKAIVIGFNVRATAGARKLAEAEGIDLRYYSIIYELIDQVKSALSGLLAPVKEEKIVGIAQVRDVFRSSKIGAIAGCMVIEGNVKRSNPIRVLRDDVVIYEGELESLRRYTDDVNEVQQGKECGIGVKNYNDVKVGDQIEVFEVVEVKREL